MKESRLSQAATGCRAHQPENTPLGMTHYNSDHMIVLGLNEVLTEKAFISRFSF